MEYDPEAVKPYLTPDQYVLYRLIWNRFVASQMAPAVFDETNVEIAAGDYLLRVKGSVPRFSGWLAVYGGAAADAPDPAPAGGPPATGEADEDGVSGVLPPLEKGQRLELKGLRPEQRFTQPPPRYSEATLVKELEENGIGRPSTYASILGTLQDRDYVQKVQGRFRPTRARCARDRSDRPVLRRYLRRQLHGEDGRAARRRSRRGRAATRRRSGASTEKFKIDLERAEREMQNLKEGIETGEACDKCGAAMLKKIGRFGPFLACSRYPDCTNTKELEPQEGTAADAGGHRGVRELRAADGRQARPVRPVPGVHGIPRVQDDAQADRTKQGLAAARPDQLLDETCPQCGAQARAEARAVRRVRGLQQLSRLQVRRSSRRPA